MLESAFVVQFIKKLRILFPGCLIIRLDSGYIQGIPDRLVLYRDKWAVLEFKAHKRAKRQPNQEYYVELMDEMSFAAFVYPENEEEILHELQLAFQSSRDARVS